MEILERVAWILPSLTAILVLEVILKWRRRAKPFKRRTIHVDVPDWLYRAFQFGPFHFTVAALTGVAVTFVPISLYILGASGAGPFDWRVLTCLGVGYFVPMTYALFGGAVTAHAWNTRSSKRPSGADVVTGPADPRAP